MGYAQYQEKIRLAVFAYKEVLFATTAFLLVTLFDRTTISRFVHPLEIQVKYTPH